MRRSKEFRIHQRERVINNRKRLLKELGTVLGIKHCDGMMDKQHPLDCGNPRCLVCHHSKIFDLENIKDKIIAEKTKSELEEVNK